MSQFVQRQNTTPQQDWSSLIAHSSAVADRYSKRNEKAAKIANQLQANMIAKGYKGSATVNASTGRVTMDKEFMNNYVARKDQDLTKAPSIKSDAKILDDPQQQKALNEYISTAKNAEERTKKVNEFYQGLADGTRSFPGQNLGRNQLLNNQIQNPKKTAPTSSAPVIGAGIVNPALRGAASAVMNGQTPNLSTVASIQSATMPDPNAAIPPDVTALAQQGKNVSIRNSDTAKEGVSTGASLDMDSKNKRDMDYKPTVVSESTVQKGVYDDTKMSLEQLSELQNFAQIMGSTDGTSMTAVPTQWDHMIIQRQNELKAAQAALEPDFKQEVKQGGFTDKSDFSFSGKVDTKDSRNVVNVTTGGVHVGDKGTGNADPAAPKMEFDMHGTTISGSFKRKGNNGTNIHQVTSSNYLRNLVNDDDSPLSEGQIKMTASKAMFNTWDKAVKTPGGRVKLMDRNGNPVNIPFSQMQKELQGQWNKKTKKWDVKPKTFADFGIERMEVTDGTSGAVGEMDIWGGMQGEFTQDFLQNTVGSAAFEYKQGGKSALSNVGR